MGVVGPAERAGVTPLLLDATVLVAHFVSVFKRSGILGHVDYGGPSLLSVEVHGHATLKRGRGAGYPERLAPFGAIIDAECEFHFSGKYDMFILIFFYRQR